jgi:hypothetical protein
MAKLGIALSGGGNRAALFCLGALLYVAHAGRNKDVSTITSVSGGSLTNAFLRLCCSSFSQQPIEQFEEGASRFARQLAGRPHYWWLTWLGLALIVAISSFLWSRSPDHALVLFGAATVAFVLWATVLGPLAGGGMWSYWGLWLYLSLTSSAALMSVNPFVELHPALRVALALGAVICAWQRHLVAGHAMMHFLTRAADAGNGVASDTGSILHVICATEMQSGEQTFFCSGNIIVSPILGISPNARFSLETAVQSSTAFPGAFPPRRMRVSKYPFPLERHFRDLLSNDLLMLHRAFRFMALSDGGVRDNMAMAWFLTLNRFASLVRSRMDRAASFAPDSELGRPWRITSFDTEQVKVALDKLTTAEPDEVVAINAAYHAPTQGAVRPWAPIFFTILALVPALAATVPNAALIYLGLVLAGVASLAFTLHSVVGAMYNSRNSLQLRELRRQFMSGERRGGVISIEDAALQVASYVAADRTVFSDNPRWPERSLIEQNPALIARAVSVRDTAIEPVPSPKEAIAMGEQRRKELMDRIRRSFAESLHEVNRLRPFCRDFPTTLNPVGLAAASKLMLHGYSVAMWSLPVYSENFPLMQQPPTLEDFSELLRSGRLPRRPVLRAVGSPP